MHNDYNNKTHTHAEQNDDFGKSKQLVKLEQEWEFRVRGAKAQGLHSELARWKRSTQAHIQRHQRASATLDILSANARNRQHFLNNALFHSSETANTFLTTCSKSELQQSDKDNSGNNEDNNSTKNDTHKKKNKQTAMGSGVSQEWMQCVNSLALAQRNLRRLLQSLQNVQRSATSRSTWDDLLRQYHDNALVFPHGMNMPLMRRWTPVTDEYYLDTSRNDEPTSSTNSGVPSEVLVVTTAQSFAFLDSAKIAVVGKKATPVKKATTTTKKKNVTKELYIHDKHDDGISLDQLQCCICLEGECNDDNDLLLCDGNGCYRSYHMECVYPHVLLETAANEDEDWFCPLCETLADALYQVQASTVGGGDEWEDRRLHRREQEKVKASNHTKSKKGCDTILDDVGSLVSWSDAADAFPNAEWTYKTAMEMQKGVRNADTQRLVFQVMGITSTFTGEDESKHVSREINRSDVDNEEEEDDDNVDEDGHFDMYSYEEERRIEREERHHEENDVDSNSVSTHSSQVTLVELSSVEMHVGKDELAALTDVDEEDASSSESPLVRQSRRLRSLKDLHQENRNGSSKRSNATANLGMMNKANIVAGKRKRRQVDYRQLNAAIFGDVTDSALETMDGGDDFVFDSSKNAFNSDDDDNDEDSETDDENDGGDIDGDSDVER